MCGTYTEVGIVVGPGEDEWDLEEIERDRTFWHIGRGGPRPDRYTPDQARQRAIEVGRKLKAENPEKQVVVRTIYWCGGSTEVEHYEKI